MIGPNGVERVQELVGTWRAQVEPLVTSDQVPMRPERLCGELTRLLPSDGILVSDTGHAGIWTGTMIDLTSPGQSFIRVRRLPRLGSSRRDRRQVRRAGPTGCLLHR